jgi:hypothetical protein
VAMLMSEADDVGAIAGLRRGTGLRLREG